MECPFTSVRLLLVVGLLSSWIPAGFAVESDDLLADKQLLNALEEARSRLRMSQLSGADLTSVTGRRREEILKTGTDIENPLSEAVLKQLLMRNINSLKKGTLLSILGAKDLDQNDKIEAEKELETEEDKEEKKKGNGEENEKKKNEEDKEKKKTKGKKEENEKEERKEEEEEEEKKKKEKKEKQEPDEPESSNKINEKPGRKIEGKKDITRVSIDDFESLLKVLGQLRDAITESDKNEPEGSKTKQADKLLTSEISNDIESLNKHKPFNVKITVHVPGGVPTIEKSGMAGNNSLLAHDDTNKAMETLGKQVLQNQDKQTLRNYIDAIKVLMSTYGKLKDPMAKKSIETSMTAILKVLKPEDYDAPIRRGFQSTSPKANPIRKYFSFHQAGQGFIDKPAAKKANIPIRVTRNRTLMRNRSRDEPALHANIYLSESLVDQLEKTILSMSHLINAALDMAANELRKKVSSEESAGITAVQPGPEPLPEPGNECMPNCCNFCPCLGYKRGRPGRVDHPFIIPFHHPVMPVHYYQLPFHSPYTAMPHMGFPAFFL